MLADGYRTRRGRRGAYLHYDAVNRVLRARRGARLAAVTNAGVIPDQFDYDVVLQPGGPPRRHAQRGLRLREPARRHLPARQHLVPHRQGGDRQGVGGRRQGQPPTMPFWLGESLGRTDELCEAVSRLCEMRSDSSLDGGPEGLRDAGCATTCTCPTPRGAAARACTSPPAKAALGVLPSRRHIVFERFFDEVGDTHLVIHSTYGSRINKAWGLALRKRMCRKFNFELQASALEDSIVLSLGPTHSFALEEVQHYLKSASARDVLVQALLDAPMFGTRWRWNATASLAVRRMNGGGKVPPQFQRSDAQDLLTVVFPDQVACAENLVGEREIPDHPLVTQTLHDCLHETMDVDGFLRAARAASRTARCRCITCDLSSPSPLSHAILERAALRLPRRRRGRGAAHRAVSDRPLMDLQTARTSAGSIPQAIAQVRADAWPEIGNADELHDALVVHGFLTATRESNRGRRSSRSCADERRVLYHDGLWRRRASAPPSSSARRKATR